MSGAECTIYLSNNDFTYDRRTIAIQTIYSHPANWLRIKFDQGLPTGAQNLTLSVDGRNFAFEDDAHSDPDTVRWDNAGLRTLTKINLSSLAVCGLFGFYAAQRGTGGHDCRQLRGGVAGIG